MASESSVRINIDLVARQAQENAKALSSSIIGVNSSVQIMLLGLSAIKGAIDSVISSFAAVTKSAIDFQTGLAEIKTVAGDVNIDKISAQLIELSNKYGLSLEDVKKGYYDLISAGVAVQDAQKALELSSKLAITGFTSQTVAVNAVTNVMNAWQLKSKDLESAGDSLAITIKKGKLTFEEYSSAIGNVSPAAAGLGISLNQTNAAIAGLTLGGKTASEAATNLKAIFEGLAKPTKELSDAYKKATGETIGQALAAGDLTKIFENLRKITGGNAQEMFKLFGSFEAGQGLVSLTGKQFEAFKDTLKEMEEAAKSAGSVLGKDFATVSETAGFKIKQGFNQLKNLGTEIGTLLLPAVGVFGEFLGNIGKNVKQFFEDNKESLKQFAFDLAASLKTALSVLGDFFKALWDNRETIKLVAEGVLSAAVAFGTLTVAMQASAAASALFASASALGGVKTLLLSTINPVVLLAAAIGALVVAFEWVSKNGELLTGVFLQLKADIASLLIPVVDKLGELVGGLGLIFLDAGKAISKVWYSIAEAADEALISLGKGIGEIGVALQPLGDALGGVFASLSTRLQGASKSLIDFGNQLKKDDAKQAAQSVQFYDGAIASVTKTTIGWGESQKRTAKASQDLADVAGQIWLKTEQAKEAVKNKTVATNELSKATENNTVKTQAQIVKEEKDKKAKEDSAKATDEYRKKLADLSDEIKKLNAQTSNVGAAFQLISTEGETKRLAEVLGQEKVVASTVEQLRLKSIGKIKEADLLRLKLVAEAEAKTAMDSAKAAQENLDSRLNNFRRNWDSFAKSEIEVLKELDAIAKADAQEQLKRQQENEKQAEENLARREANYRSNWDSFAKTETDVAKQTQEDVTKIIEEENDKRSISLKAVLDTIKAFAAGVGQTFSGATKGIEQLASGNIIEGIKSSYSEIFAGIAASTSVIGNALLDTFASPKLKEEISAIAGFIGDSIGGAFKLSFELLDGAISTSKAAIENTFSALSGGVVAGFASGIKGVLASFQNSITSISEGTKAVVEFGVVDTSEQKKVIEDEKKTAIDAVKERYAQELEAAKDVSSKLSDDKKSELEAAIKAIKSKQDEEIKSIQRQSEANQRALDIQKAGELSVKNITSEQRIAINAAYAERKAAERTATQDRIEAIKKETETAIDAEKSRIAGISTEQKAAIKAIEDKRDAELKAIEDVAVAKAKSIETTIENSNIFAGVAASVDEFASAFESKIPSIVGSFIKNIPSIITSFVKSVSKITASIAKEAPKVIQAFVAEIPIIIKTLLASAKDVIGALISQLPTLFKVITAEIPNIIRMLVESIVSSIDTLLPPFIMMISTLIQEVILQAPKILDAILGVIPLIIAELPKIITALVEAMPSIIQAVVDNLPAIIEAIIVAVPQIITAIISNLPQIILAVIASIPSIVGALISGIVGALGELFPWFANLGREIWNGLQSMASTIFEWFKGLGRKIWEGITLIAQEIWMFFSDLGGAIWQGFILFVEEITAFFLSLGTKIWEGLKSVSEQIWTFFRDAGGYILDGLKNAINGVGNFFYDIGKKIWDGLKSGLDTVGNFFTGSKSSSGIPIIGPVIDWISGWSNGGMIGGNAKFMGDSRANDTVPALLSPGELVIPRSVVDAGLGDVMRFAAKYIGDSSSRMPTFSQGGIVSSSPSGRAVIQADNSDLVFELQSLRNEIHSIGYTLAKAGIKTVDYLERWDAQGIPQTRNF